MAQRKKQGLIDRMLLGKEKSEGYARAQLPSNRWELFWDILKGRFWKLVVINLLMLVFFIPLAALLFFRYIALVNYGIMYPFNQCFGIGYGAASSLVGYAENIVFNINLLIYLLLPIAACIAAVGVSGGAYVIRNMVWTEGIFVANDFWRGIKQNVGQMLSIALVYSLVFYLSVLSIAMSEYSLAVDGGRRWMFILSEVLSYSILALYSIMTFHMFTMSVTYDIKFGQLIKNSFLLTIGMFPQNIFFIALGSIPFICLLFGQFLQTLGIVLILLLGLSVLFLVWTDFCQWAYDRFINDKIPGAQKNRGIYEKIKESDAGALKQYREQVAMAARTALSSRPIKPITDDLEIEELPTSFRREDIIKLNESKQRIIEDHERYVQEHKNDPQFQFEEDKSAEQEREEREKRMRSTTS